MRTDIATRLQIPSRQIWHLACQLLKQLHFLMTETTVGLSHSLASNHSTAIGRDATGHSMIRSQSHDYGQFTVNQLRRITIGQLIENPALPKGLPPGPVSRPSWTNVRIWNSSRN
jgi:hypothetical protein